MSRISGYVGHVTIIQLNVHYCVLFSGRLGLGFGLRFDLMCGW